MQTEIKINETTAKCSGCGFSTETTTGDWDDHIHDGWTGLPDSWAGIADYDSVMCDECSAVAGR